MNRSTSFGSIDQGRNRRLRPSGSLQSLSPTATDSSFGDSFEISAADFEVGTIAARKSQEKATDRRRRIALDVAPHLNVKDPTIPTKIAASPDVLKVHKVFSV